VLRVTPEGHRSWVAWLKREKTRRWQKFTIGAYPVVTLARARQETLRLRQAVLDGKDPFDARAAGRGRPSLKTLGETFVTRYAKPKKRSWEEDERKLIRDVYPVLGSYRADLVTKGDVVELLDTICDRGAPIAANRTLALVRKLFSWAVAEGYIDANPATGIPMRARENVRRRVLDEEELKLFWRALDGPGFDDVTADALRLQLLLGARIREVTGMARAELSLNADVPVWTLPATRAKGGREVTRPLPPMALAIIKRRLEALREDPQRGAAAAARSGKAPRPPEPPYVFASPADKGQPITSRAPTRALHRAGELGRIMTLRSDKPGKLSRADRIALWAEKGFTPHDLRRTCRTFWAKAGIPETVAKKILGHVPPRSDVTASVYDQHTYLPEMMEALARWERQLLALVKR
jgi:integrase